MDWAKSEEGSIGSGPFPEFSQHKYILKKKKKIVKYKFNID